MFERKTRDVVVRVEPDFLAEQSSPSEGRFIWAYTVEIENQSDTDLQVVERFWQIADSHGMAWCMKYAAKVLLVKNLSSNRVRPSVIHRVRPYLHPLV